MTLEEIKKAITEALEGKYPDAPLYGIEELDGYERPGFFLFLTASLELQTVNFRQMHCEVDIARIQVKTDEQDVIQYYENVAELFSPKIQVGDQYFDTEDMTFSYLGEYENVPNVSFSFDYYEKMPQETAEIAGKVTMRTEVTEGDYHH